MRGILLQVCGTLALLGVLNQGDNAARGAERPNIAIIMCDDMGFSDIGCYGGEIATPALDRLAGGGLRFSQFYNTGRCCPTRASLLTGLYAHQAGVGHMTQDKGQRMPGYRGHLTERCVTIGEVLRRAGYFTAVSGKWHVGSDDKAWWPLARGFDRFYGIPQGGGFFFKVKQSRDVVFGNEIVYSVDNQPPEGWYTTDAWNEYAVRFIDDAREADKPFFLYLAHNAPHFPLQVPEGEIEKYLDLYRDGWDPIRTARWEKQKRLGLVTDAWRFSPRDVPDKAWSGLTDKARARQIKAMAIYGAMVEHMDRTIGDLVAALEERQMLDNTLILFLSDNGGCAEGGVLAVDSQKSDVDDWGSHKSYIRCGKLWANAQNTPFRRYKHHTHEGGISTPLIAHWPTGIPRGLHGRFCHTPSHVIDLMATCVDLAGATYPEDFGGQQIIPLEGRSLVPLLEGETGPIHEALFWEHEGNRAIRIGDWKLVAGHNRPWELYDLSADRSELSDLAEDHPQRAKRMAEEWEDWARESYVLPWEVVTGKRKRGG